MCLLFGCCCQKKKFRKESRPTLQNQTQSLQQVNRKSKFVIESVSNKLSTFQFKDQFRCFFCGGKNCKHENWRNHPNPAIKGLNCDLIDNCVYASQRISTVLIKQFGLIASFKANRIGLIINVQREGEHPFCGPNEGLEESGFTYDPEDFVSEGIRVIHSGWKDMSVPDSVSFVLKLVKEMHLIINKNKERVLVHCHAGYGRTGIIVACYLIYHYRISAEAAVQMVRSYRSKCIEKSEQFNFCVMFENCKYQVIN